MTDHDEMLTPQPARVTKDRRQLPSWRWEELRTTLWVVPGILVVVLGPSVPRRRSRSTWPRTTIHRAAALDPHRHTEAERQVLIAIAAATITVVGVVFSITILALTLASQQFGPRMMRNFVRDIGNQVTLGIFVGTFVYAVLVLVSIGSVNEKFVPSLSTSVAEVLLMVVLAVLIYFIHHIAKSIQLPEVIAGIVDDLMKSIDAEFPDDVGAVAQSVSHLHSGKVGARAAPAH